MSAVYELRAKDPSGEFVRVSWSTPYLPQVGDLVMLPEQPSLECGWQELRVEDVVHYWFKTEVWFGTPSGWDDGSVAELFRNADAWNREKGAA